MYRPGLCWCCSSAKLAFSYSQWQLFFGMSDSPMINSAVGQQLQQAREQAMQQRLANRPVLLTAHVENLVANYYEMANMIDSQVGGAGGGSTARTVRCMRWACACSYVPAEAGVMAACSGHRRFA